MNPKDLKPGERRTVRRGIYAYRTKEGRVHYGISYSYQGSIHKEIIGPHLRQAEQALAVRRSELAQGRFQLHKRKQPPSFGEFASSYLDYAKTNKKSWALDEYLLTALSPAFGRKRLDEITTWDVERFKSARREKVSARTVNMELSLLRRMFHLARDWGQTEADPLKTVKSLREGERTMRVLSPDEEKKLMPWLPPHIQDVAAFALHTGLRRGEILNLRTTRVDTENRYLTIGETKTGKVRRVPLNAVALEILRRQHPTEEGYVFTYHGGRYESFGKAWRRAVKNAGIPKIRFHDLRHTFATRLVLAGEDISVVQELLGHASIVMTRRYAHPSAEHRKAAVAKLETFGGGKRTRTKVARRGKRHRVKITARF